MNINAFMGAVEIGFIFAFVSIGVYISFRILDFPDLTVDGSFVLGGALFGLLAICGINPWLSMFGVLIAGAIAGLATAFLNIRFQILNLLASILTMTALLTINQWIMGGKIGSGTLNFPYDSTITASVLNIIEIDPMYARPLIFGVLALIAVIIVWWYLISEAGLAMRATGINPRMAKAQGISTALYIYAGMALSNALVAFGGALFAQTTFNADLTAGPGTIVYGLAAVIIGEAIFRTRSIFWLLISCVVGSLIYRLVVQFAMAYSGDMIGTAAMPLITTIIVTMFLVVPKFMGAKDND